jgi:ubiquinone/menaquinone biosynthesis C-methylase UbiE
MSKNKKGFTRGYGLIESFLAKKRSKTANTLIPPTLRGGRILDIGCGTYPYFLAKTEFNEKYGIDKSDEITQYTQYTPPLHLQQLDFANQSELPFENNYFNVVTMLAVIEHIDPPNTRHLISETFRILQKDGLLILTTPAAWANSLLHRMSRLKLVSPEEINDHKDTYSHKKITALLQDGGFKKENIKLGYFEMFMNIWACAGK